MAFRSTCSFVSTNFLFLHKTKWGSLSSSGVIFYFKRKDKLKIAQAPVLQAMKALVVKNWDKDWREVFTVTMGSAAGTGKAQGRKSKQGVLGVQ